MSSDLRFNPGKKMFSRYLLFGWIVLSLVLPAVGWAQDPSGAATGSAVDVPAAVAGQPTLEEVANAAGHNKVAINRVNIGAEDEGLDMPEMGIPGYVGVEAARE